MIPVLFNILFFLIPLIFFKNTSELFEFNKIVTLYSVTTIITSIWIINSIKEKRIIFRKTLLDWPLISYLVVLLISSLVSIDPRTSWLGYYGRFNGGLISQICYAILYWSFVSNLNKVNGLRVMSYGLAGTAIAAIMAIAEHFGVFTTCGLMGFGYTESCWVQDVQTRVFSTLGQPNWLAAMLTALMPIAWSQMLNFKKLNAKYLSFAFLSFIFFLTLLLTKSRSGFLAFGIEVVIFWGFIFWKEKLKYLKKFLLLVVVSVIIFFVFSSPLSNQVTNHQSSTSSATALEVGGTESGTIRKFVWLGAIEVFKHYPILGTGPETFAFSFPMYKPIEHNLTSEWDFIYNKAHNELLNILANVGILGLLSYLLIIIFSIIIIWKSKRFDLLSGYVAILVTNFFGFSVVPVSLLFFLLPAIALVISDERLMISKNTQKIDSTQMMFIVVIFLTSLYSLFSIHSYWKADIYFNNSKTINDKSITEIDKALQILPNEPIYISQKAFLTTDVNLSLKALDLAPYNQNVTKVLISNLIKSSDENPNNLLLAENIILSAIDNAPNDPRLYYQLGILKLKMNKNDEAVKSLQKSVELKPNYKEARFALGATHKALNENLKAKEQFEYILKNIDPNDELTKKYLDEINFR